MAKKMRKSNHKKPNTELLIDGENIGTKKTDAIMNAVESQGKLYEGKVYGRQKDVHTRGWSDKAREYGIKDIRMCGGPRKDKIDNKIKRDARRLTKQHKNVDIVCIATNDGGYVDIVKELRSIGKRVVVIGERQASALLRESCNQFVEI